MKKLALIFSCSLIALTLTACTSESPSPTNTSSDTSIPEVSPVTTENVSPDVASAVSIDPSATPIDEPVLSAYEIYSISIISTDEAVPVFAYDIVVANKPTLEQLEEISKQAVETAKGSLTFNGLLLRFYDLNEYTSFEPTLGQAVFAPNGQLEKSGDVVTGDFNSMEIKNELLNKDWSLQLSQQDAALWAEFKREYPNLAGSESEKISQFAQNKGMTDEQINELLSKHDVWSRSGK